MYFESIQIEFHTMFIVSFDEVSSDYLGRIYDVVLYVMRDDSQYNTWASHAR